MILIKLTKSTMPSDPEIERMRRETVEVCLNVLEEQNELRGDYKALARGTLVIYVMLCTE